MEGMEEPEISTDLVLLLSTQVRFVGFGLRPFLRTEAAGPQVPEPPEPGREQKKQTWPDIGLAGHGRTFAGTSWWAVELWGASALDLHISHHFTMI